MEDDTMRYEIFNAEGRMVRNYFVFENAIELSGLANGLYVLKIIDGSNIITKKILKNSF